MSIMKSHVLLLFQNVRRTFLQVTILALATAAASAHAEWSLNGDKSAVNFVTTKAVDIKEIQGFQRLSGSVGKDGQAQLKIALASISTGIPIRDERMSKFLFEVERFPEAIMSAQVPIADLAALAAGESSELRLEGKLAMRGFTLPITSDVQVVKLQDGSLQVNSLAPVIINGGDLGLLDGIEKLRELAGLPSIAKSVAVSYRLNFSR